jgi:hypothetical protein
MIEILLIAGMVIALALGVWIGLGAPGWPVPPEARSRRLEKRSINPVAWGRTGRRERLSPRRPEDRRPRLR